MQTNTVDELISDLRQGRMVVLLDDDADSHNEGVVMVAAERAPGGCESQEQVCRDSRPHCNQTYHSCLNHRRWAELINQLLKKALLTFVKVVPRGGY